LSTWSHPQMYQLFLAIYKCLPVGIDWVGCRLNCEEV
jgi:hypothetical protein